MSANKSNGKPESRVLTKKAVHATGVFSVKYPLLWLMLAVLVVYFPTFYFEFTELDDSIFIREFQAYNQDLHNLITSFGRGVFDAVKDPYYRPLFLDSMVLNYQLSNDGTNIVSYHVINTVFHLINVLLLFRLFRVLGIIELQAFIMALFFAIHPVLVQAVAWIPGRNDTMLAIFTLSFFLFTVYYSNSGKIKYLLLSVLMLLLAFFTKETAVIAAPAACVILIVFLEKSWNDKKLLIQYGLWLLCFVFWYVVRSQVVSAAIATGTSNNLFLGFLHRLPVIVQYLGKVFLPMNLSVFPTQQDTVYYYGLIALALVGLLLYLNKYRRMRLIMGGVVLFLLFLLPVLFLPNNLNEQTFEHRLYLPMIGILLLLPQTVLFMNKLSGWEMLMTGLGISLILIVFNYRHQRHFSTPLAFWTQAAATSPNSAYANMMLAARIDNLEQSYELFRKAYLINPDEKYLNFYYGVMLQKQDSVPQSERFLLKEKNTSGYYECDFYLARVAMERKDMNAAIWYLQTYLTHDAGNKIANTNLLLLYIDTQQPDKAREQARAMKRMGMDVPPPLAQQLGV